MKKTDINATELESSTRIRACIEEVWRILKFPGKIDTFHPLVKRSYLISNQTQGVGVKRHCDLLPMGAMDEVITSWNEGKSFTTKVVGGRMLPPFVFMKGTIRLDEDNQHTRATFTLSYKLKFGNLGRLMNFLLIKPQFKSAPRKYVEGLKSYVEAL
ncbi:MAG: SRPBCC family protein [Bacteroidota bacterium]